MSANSDGGRGVSVLELIFETARTAWRDWRRTLMLFGAGLIIALVFALLRPMQYVVSMVVTPVESTYSDPTQLISSPGLSIRTPLNLIGGPPPQMAAFIKLLKTPELARHLVHDPRALQAINGEPGMLSHFLSIFQWGPPKPVPERKQVSATLQWLDEHITVDQDIDVRTWTINLRYPDADTGVYMLTQIHADSEQILRQSAIIQFQKQSDYGMRLVRSETDATRRTTLYGILASLDRSLLVLKSGANVATLVISTPYAPNRPTSPPRLISFLAAFIPLTLGIFGYLVVRTYRTKRRPTNAQDIAA